MGGMWHSSTISTAQDLQSATGAEMHASKWPAPHRRRTLGYSPFLLSHTLTQWLGPCPSTKAASNLKRTARTYKQRPPIPTLWPDPCPHRHQWRALPAPRQSHCPESRTPAVLGGSRESYKKCRGLRCTVQLGLTTVERCHRPCAGAAEFRLRFGTSVLAFHKAACLSPPPATSSCPAGPHNSELCCLSEKGTQPTRWCRPRCPVLPMYMPGRLRTGSSPCSTCNTQVQRP